MNDVQPIEQILSKRVLRNQPAKVAIGSRNHSHVDPGRRTIRANFLELPGFQKSQEQSLHSQGHLAQLVHQDSPAVSQLELASLVSVRAGEAAFDVPEQLGFEQGLRQSGAIHGDEGSASAQALAMDSAGHQLLPDSTLAS